MRPTSGPPFRAEHIGSLIRPPELLRARQQHAAGQIDRDSLVASENEAIRRVVNPGEGLQA
jgi:5-methyltetrahydropteroyltriglutamate--homocysteine methyltransferase